MTIIIIILIERVQEINQKKLEKSDSKSDPKSDAKSDAKSDPKSDPKSVIYLALILWHDSAFDSETKQ